MKGYLGLDLGTSAVKAIVIGQNGMVLGDGSCDLSINVLRPGFVEQDPNEWWYASAIAIKQAVKACPSDTDISGIGISGQMLGTVLLNKTGEPVDKCIIWMDQRASRELYIIVNKIGLSEILDKTANYPLVSYWAPKILWFREHRPEVYANTRTVLFPKDYLKYLMTGVFDIDVTDATGTMLYNTAERKWEWSLFDALKIPKSLVPAQTSESCQVVGYLQKSAADYLELPAGIPVVSGGGDQMCGAIGLGVVREGVIASTIGTSGTVFSYSSTCITDRKPRALLSYCHSIPEAWCIYGCTLAAGGSYQWLRNALFLNTCIEWEMDKKNIYKFMDECAGKAKPGCEGLTFLPYINGERTPYPNPFARGVLFGISSRHGINEICRAVMEGVTYSLRDIIEILREYNIPINEIRATGGGAKSELWLQLQADIFNADIITTNISESPAAGAAILASVGAGAFPDVASASDVIVRKASLTKPKPENVALYSDYYESYKSLYPALEPIYSIQAKKVERWK